MATLSAFSAPSWPNPNPNPNPNIDVLSHPDYTSNDLSPPLLHDTAENDDNEPPYYPQTTLIQNPNPKPNFLDRPSLSAPTLLHVAFNQDYGCFATGTDRGFRIYNCDPFREIFRRDFENGGVCTVEMLFRCNILALVGGGPDPQYPLNKVMIWDDHQSRCIGELSFRSEVRGVRLRRDRIVVVLEQKIFVYNFSDLKLLHQIETIANPKGLCAVSQGAASLVLVCPGLQKGQVRVEHYASKRTKFIMAHDSRIACFALTQDGHLLATASTKGTLVRIFNTFDGSLLQEGAASLVLVCPGLQKGQVRVEHYASKRTKFIMAHDSWIACFALTQDGHVLATASTKGTLVRIFNTFDGSLLQEVRRGADRAEIYSLAFSSTAHWLAVSSDKGTVHVFGLKFNLGNLGSDKLHGGSDPNLNRAVSSPSSSLSFMKGVLPKYFSSEWSVAQFRLLEGSQYIVAFGHQKNTVVILGLDGSFYRCQFDPVSGGEMTQLEYHNFLKPEEGF